MQKQCVSCKNEFEAKRSDARTCSIKCRVTLKRENLVTDNSVTDNVTDNFYGWPEWKYGEPNWKKNFETMDEAKASLLNKLAEFKGMMGRFIAFGYEFPAKEEKPKVA